MNEDWDDPRSGTLIGGRFRMLYFSVTDDWGVLDEFVGIGYVRCHERSYTDAVLVAERLSGRRPTTLLVPVAVDTAVDALLSGAS